VRGKIPERPFVLVAQQSLFDETRAPRGQHTLWAYCHVPFNCGTDMSDKLNRRSSDSRPVFAIVFSPAMKQVQLILPDQIRIWGERH
jgi:Phytoene dehydrogenase and related proteins